MSETALTLPVPPNEESIRLLLRARMMFSHALEHATQNTEFDNMIAVLGLDNTIESILRCIVTHLDLETLTGKSFDTIMDIASLAGEINKALRNLANVQLPYLGEVKVLRQTRNLVQHGAIAPNAELKRFITITQRFFDKALQIIFGLELNTLNISSVIKDNQIQEFLKKAESYIEEKNWLLSVVSSRDAFENDYFRRAKSLTTSIFLYPSILYGTEEFAYLGTGLDAIREELELSYLGINNADYRRFKDYMNHIPSEYRPKDSSEHNIMQRPWSKEDAMFCYAFSANTILRWQEREREGLYPPPQLDKNYDFVQWFNEVNLSENAEMGSLYFSDNSEVFILSFVPTETMIQLEDLEKNKVYLQKTERFVDGILDIVSKQQVEFLGKYKFLITNNPERWGILLWYRGLEDEIEETDTTNSS